MESFYGFVLVEQLDILEPVTSLEAWRAQDGDQSITLVRSRPDIIAEHLAGNLYCSNVPDLDADLQAIADRGPGPHELRLREVRRVEGGTLPIAVFDTYGGWPLREVARRVTCEPPIAAAIVLEIFRTTTTTVTERGELVRQVLPDFERVWESEAPTTLYYGVHARIRDGRRMLATMTSIAPRDDRDNDTDEAAEAFVAELKRIADYAAVGPTVAAILAPRP